MLNIRFFNVGDGDAILVEERTGERVFRLLVDAGRDAVAEPAPCAVCAAHLARLGVGHLDLVIITHLHIDHFGGLAQAAASVVIDEVASPYFPQTPDARIDEEPSSEKTVQGMIDSLNRWSSLSAALRQKGTRCTALERGRTELELTDRLRVEAYVPDGDALRLQRAVWDSMFAGRQTAQGNKVRASKMRNPNSVYLRLRYAGRVTDLGGDCYGAVRENAPLASCDILKVPHHGDAKALTDRLVQALQPTHAVISCGRDYLPEKDRPSKLTADCLRGVGARVWYTDAYDDGTEPVRVWPGVDFIIDEQGGILPPDEIGARNN